MQLPYMNSIGNLVIPNFADIKYHWWLESTDEQPRLSLSEVLDIAGATPEDKARIMGENEAKEELIISSAVMPKTKGPNRGGVLR